METPCPDTHSPLFEFFPVPASNKEKHKKSRKNVEKVSILESLEEN